MSGTTVSRESGKALLLKPLTWLSICISRILRYIPVRANRIFNASREMIEEESRS